MATPRKSPAQRFLELKQELQKLEFFCKGTVLERRMKCDQAACPCHMTPPNGTAPIGSGPINRKPKPSMCGSVRLLAPSTKPPRANIDRKITRLNSSHANISYAVF